MRPAVLLRMAALQPLSSAADTYRWGTQFYFTRSLVSSDWWLAKLPQGPETSGGRLGLVNG